MVNLIPPLFTHGTLKYAYQIIKIYKKDSIILRYAQLLVCYCTFCTQQGLFRRDTVRSLRKQAVTDRSGGAVGCTTRRCH